MENLKRLISIFVVMILVMLVIPSVLPGASGTMTVEAAATTAKLSKKNVTLIKGKSVSLSVSGTKKTVTWSSSNKKTAVVNSKGKVTAKAKGTAKITARVGNDKLTCKVVVETPAISKSTLTLTKGASGSLKVKGTTQKVKWSSSNTAVAVVLSAGKVSAKKKGTAVITAKVSSSRYTCKVQVHNPYLNKSSLSLEEGKSFQLKTSGMTKNLAWSSSDKSVASVSKSGKVKALSVGKTVITAKDSKGRKGTCKVTVTEKIITPTVYGFSVSGYYTGDTMKVHRDNSRNADGSNTYEVEFLCDGSEVKLSEVTYEVKDVTPTAYKKMFSDMKVSSKKPSLKVTSDAENLRSLMYYYQPTVLEPFTSKGAGDSDVPAVSGKLLTIKAGTATRAVKITAKRKGKVLDTVYVVSSGMTQSYEYSSHDLALYQKVRKKIESKLWKSSMSKKEKLQAIAGYINRTTHYPYSDATSQEGNPTFWKDWSIDGKMLYWSVANDIVLNRIMDFQGGIVTCQAAGIIETVATDDLGMKYLYDSKTDKVLSGEGVWRALGSYSSNPTNPYHETLWYKNSSGQKTAIDAQGIDYGSCAEHGCKQYVISLK